MFFQNSWVNLKNNCIVFLNFLRIWFILSKCTKEVPGMARGYHKTCLIPEYCGCNLWEFHVTPLLLSKWNVVMRSSIVLALLFIDLGMTWRVFDLRVSRHMDLCDPHPSLYVFTVGHPLSRVSMPCYIPIQEEERGCFINCLAESAFSHSR